MNILSIQSHVVYGRVGNRVSVFALERMGHELWPINTVQFSSHAGKQGYRGMAFGAEHIRDLVLGLENLNIFHLCDAVLTGYIGDSATGKAITEAVLKVKAANPKALYCCDPVMGDYPEGMYVKPALKEFFLKEAMPLADIAMPNVFEAEMLSGINIVDEASALKAVLEIQKLGPGLVIITSYKENNGNTGFFAGADGKMLKVLSPVLAFKNPPKGSGDLSTALFLGYYLKTRKLDLALEQTLSALYGILEATLASELEFISTVTAQDLIASPPSRFPVIKVQTGPKAMAVQF